jgi:hypothetical protein
MVNRRGHEFGGISRIYRYSARLVHDMQILIGRSPVVGTIDLGRSSPWALRSSTVLALVFSTHSLAELAFATDVAPWATVAKQWATACKHLIAMLEALDDKRSFNAPVPSLVPALRAVQKAVMSLLSWVALTWGCSPRYGYEGLRHGCGTLGHCC